MTELQAAKQQLQEAKNKRQEIFNKLNKNRRLRAKIKEDIEKEKNGDCNIDKLTELRMKLDTISEVISDLSDKLEDYEKYELEKAKHKVKKIKGKSKYLERNINENLINIELRKEELKDLKFEVQKLENIIDDKKENIENLKKQYKNTTTDEPEILEGKELEKMVYQAKLENMTGQVVDKNPASIF